MQDQNLTTPVDMSISITFLGTDADNDPLTYMIAGNPIKGTLGTLVGNQITYTPSGALGEDTFLYTAIDAIDTSAPAIVRITNTPGALQAISIDVSNTTPTTGDSVSVAIYGEDMFGNVVPDTIQSTATGDAALDVVGGTLSKPTAGTTTVSATAGSISVTPVDIIFSDPLVVALPEPVVTARSGGGHPPIENTNPVVVPPAPILDTPEQILAEAVNVEVLTVPTQIQKPVPRKKVVVKNETAQEIPNQSTLLAASSEASFPIQKKTGVYAIIIAICAVLGWRIFIQHKNKA